MSGELLVNGDRPLPPHALPPVPKIRRSLVRSDGVVVETDWELVNAVAQCDSCGQLFVSREDPDGWGRVVRWVPLRWWHRKAWAKLRVEEARRIGGVAP